MAWHALTYITYASPMRRDVGRWVMGGLLLLLLASHGLDPMGLLERRTTAGRQREGLCCNASRATQPWPRIMAVQGSSAVQGAENK